MYVQVYVARYMLGGHTASVRSAQSTTPALGSAKTWSLGREDCPCDKLYSFFGIPLNLANLRSPMFERSGRRTNSDHGLRFGLRIVGED
jgi:hypothetical protein